MRQYRYMMYESGKKKRFSRSHETQKASTGIGHRCSQSTRTHGGKKTQTNHGTGMNHIGLKMQTQKLMVCPMMQKMTQKMLQKIAQKVTWVPLAVLSTNFLEDSNRESQTLGNSAEGHDNVFIKNSKSNAHMTLFTIIYPLRYRAYTGNLHMHSQKQCRRDKSCQSGITWTHIPVSKTQTQ